MRRTTGLPHRLQFVRERDGVRWYDDSKATNVGAVEKSIDSFPGGIVLLLGGYDKGGDFAALRPRIESRVAEVICHELAHMWYGDLVKVTTFLTDRSQAERNSEIRRDFLGDHRPALTVIVAQTLDAPWLLEIEAIAAK